MSPHELVVRVYYEDTDAAGIVYHANYLKFAERGRTELLRSLGYDHGRLAGTHGLVFAVVRCEIDFVRPARLDDLLQVRTRVEAIRGARLELAQVVMREDALVARVTVTLAVVDVATTRPAHVPTSFAKRSTT